MAKTIGTVANAKYPRYIVIHNTLAPNAVVNGRETEG